MVQLLKIKEHIYRFIGKYEIYTIAVFRFLVAFAAFTLINQKIGYMDLLKEYPIPLLFALLCSFLPSGMMLFLGAVLILLNCYALSLELCGIVALIFVILFCIYFRFSRKKGMYAVLTPVLGVAGIPYVVPVASGLLSRVYAVVSVVCGEMVFFLLKNINENAALFSAKDGITKKSVVTLAVTEIFTDKEMYIFLGGFAAAAIVVSCIRKLTVDHGRTIAAVIGIAVEMGIICSGEIYIGESGRIVKVIAGCIISLLIVLVLDFMTLSVDYSRVEHTQFEDDEYYYYVKAIPKVAMTTPEKTVKKINERQETEIIDAEAVKRLSQDTAEEETKAIDLEVHAGHGQKRETERKPSYGDADYRSPAQIRASQARKHSPKRGPAPKKHDMKDVDKMLLTQSLENEFHAGNRRKR